MVDCMLGTTLVGTDARGCGGQCITVELAEPPLADGPDKLNVDDPDVVAVLNAGMKLLNAQSHCRNLVRATRLVEATRQIADGIRYRLIIEWGETECKNDPGVARSSQDCPLHGDSQFLELVVWDKPYEDPDTRYSLGNIPVLPGVPVDCPMFKCANTDCEVYAKDANGCQDGCSCAKLKDAQMKSMDEDSDDSDDSDDEQPNSEEAYKAEAVMYGIMFGIGAFAVLAVPTVAYLYKKHHAHRDATVVLSGESAQLSSPTARRIEEGAKDDLGPEYTQVPKGDQL